MAVRTASLHTLSRREARVFEALARALFPRDRAIDIDEDDAAVVAALDDYTRRLPRQQQLNVKALVAGVEVAWLTHQRRPGLLADAPRTAVLAFIDAWSNSGNYTLRQLWLAVKGMLTLAYVEAEPVQAALGITEEAV